MYMNVGEGRERGVRKIWTAQKHLKFECEINIKTYQIFNVDICTLLYQFFHKNNIPSTRCLKELREAVLCIDGRLR